VRFHGGAPWPDGGARQSSPNLRFQAPKIKIKIQGDGEGDCGSTYALGPGREGVGDVHGGGGYEL